MILFSKPVAPLFLSVTFGLSSTVLAEPSAQFRQRAFRPIEPIERRVTPAPPVDKREIQIKQNVVGGESEAVEKTISVKIPPPPIPKPENSLFPEGSIPDVDFPPEAFVEVEGDSEFESTDTEETLPGNSEASSSDLPTLSRLREEAHKLADDGLTYKFGADDPDEGGLDCSGAMQHLLTKIGIKNVPRTSYNQYYWLKKKKMLDDVYGKNASSKMLKKLAPGDLIFWGGTWKSGHRVSHVMLYMGYNPDEDKHYIFGARGKSTKGMLGNGVDIFELDPDRGRLIAHGKIPGLIYD